MSAFRRSVRRAVRLKSTQLRRSSSLIGRPKAGVRRVRLARFCGCPGQLCGRRVIESACGRPEDSRYAALRILIHRLSLLRNQCGHCAYGSNLSLTITHASSHRLCVGWCRSQSVSRVARLPSLIGRPPPEISEKLVVRLPVELVQISNERSGRCQQRFSTSRPLVAHA